MTTSNEKNTVETNNGTKKLTKNDLRKVFWRSCAIDFSWNFERQCSMGYAYAMAPVIRKLYTKKEDISAALKRHLEFFNVTSQVSTLPLGISAAMEEENANNPDFDTSSINGVKTALMGPVSAIGDSVFWGTLRLLATGIGTSLALQGSILGAILFLVIFNVPAFIARYFLTDIGYNAGTSFLQKLEKTGTLDDLTYGAGILGLMVIGAMVASMVSVSTPLTIGSGDGAYALQTMFDSIMPCLLPLASFGIVYKLLDKTKNSMLIILGIFAVSILCALFGILG